MHLLVFLRSLYLCSDEESKSRKKKEHKVYVLVSFFVTHNFLAFSVLFTSRSELIDQVRE